MMRIDMQYILSATPERLREVTVMALFDSAFQLWTAEHGEHTYYLPLRFIHKHVSVFVHELGLVIPSFDSDESGISPAAGRFFDSTKNPSQNGTILGWQIAEHEFSTDIIRSRCEVYAKLVGVDLDQVRKAFEAFITKTTSASATK